MYFEASVNKTPYKVIVNENRNEWIVSVQKEENSEWKEYNVPKADFQNNVDGNISFIYKNSSYLVDIVKRGVDYEVYTRGSHRNVSIVNDELILRDSLKGGRSLGGQENLKAGMPGKIVKIFVKEGQEVKQDEPLLIMEAMKMENEMRAGSDVKVKRIHFSEGDNVETGSLLISFEG